MPRRLLVCIAAATAAVVNVLVVALFDTPWWASSPIGLVLGALAAHQATQLTKEKRNGRHRRTEADTSDSEAVRAAIADALRPGDGTIHYAGSSTLNARRAIAASYARARPWAGTSFDPDLEAPAEPEGPERVESDMPILAHRAARLVLDGTSRNFRSVATDSVDFGVDADAHCIQWRGKIHAYVFSGVDLPVHHDAPALSCTCGFYALPTDLAPTYVNPAYVTLMVELSGTVIEHEKGYRAEHQRVIECRVPACVYCGAEADLVVVRKFLMDQATCAAHKPVDEPGVVYLDVADLAAMLPVPVTRSGRRKLDARGGEG